MFHAHFHCFTMRYQRIHVFSEDRDFSGTICCHMVWSLKKFAHKEVRRNWDVILQAVKFRPVVPFCFAARFDFEKKWSTIPSCWIAFVPLNNELLIQIMGDSILILLPRPCHNLSNLVAVSVD